MSLLDISSKFTEDTLDEIVRRAGGTKHISYKFGQGFKKGDSYLSKVFRLTIFGVAEGNGTPIEVNIIVKSMPDNLARRKLFRSQDFFRNEINFYKYVVPAWEQFQAKRKPCKPFTEYPICYATYCDGEHDFIALEDVSFSGYRSPNRQSFITLEECMLTMRTLGRFHGVSLALRALEPDIFNEVSKYLEETYYSEQNRAWYNGFLKLACTVAKDAIAKIYPDTRYEKIASQFLQEHLYNDLIQLVSAPSNYKVFGHGDCWSPNFLTKYAASGSPEAVKVIDFQLARCSSLALDISFFIYSCTSKEMREQHYINLLKEYHRSAISLLKDLGADSDAVLPWEGLLNELELFGRFGCGMGIESLPMSIMDDEDVADLDEIKENAVLTDVWNIKPFKDTARCQRIADIFKHAIDQGYIK